MTEREKCLQALSAAQFAAWELHLYLDTHPNDENAKIRHEKYSAEYAALRTAYEEKYGPLSAKTGHGKNWLANPWPWDIEGCVR